MYYFYVFKGIAISLLILYMMPEHDKYHKTLPHEKGIKKRTMGHENTFYHNVTIVWEELRVKLKTKLIALLFNYFIATSYVVCRRDRGSKETKKNEEFSSVIERVNVSSKGKVGNRFYIHFE